VAKTSATCVQAVSRELSASMLNPMLDESNAHAGLLWDETIAAEWTLCTQALPFLSTIGIA
jgi:hypothetical protein